MVRIKLDGRKANWQAFFQRELPKALYDRCQITMENDKFTIEIPKVFTSAEKDLAIQKIKDEIQKEELLYED